MRHLSKRFAFAAILAVALPACGSAKTISASPPPLPTHSSAPAKFVPAGWRLWQIRKGDLNGDGVSDAVLIMQRRDRYSLAVVFGNSTGVFDLVTENKALLNGVPDPEMVSPENGDHHGPLPDSDGLKIHHGVFSVQMSEVGIGGAGVITFTFRYDGGHFVLIGYDYYGSHQGWIKLSFNMLTGQTVQTESDYDGDGNIVHKKRVGKFPLPKPTELDKIGNAFDFDESFNPIQYSLSPR